MITDISRKIVNNIVWFLGKFFNILTPNKNNNNIAILRTDGLGDFVLFTPTLKYFRENYKKYKITFTIKENIESLVQNCDYKNIVAIYFTNFRFYGKFINKVLIYLSIPSIPVRGLVMKSSYGQMQKKKLVGIRIAQG